MRRPLVAVPVLAGALVLLGSVHIWHTQTTEIPRARPCQGVLAEDETQTVLAEKSLQESTDIHKGTLHGKGQSLVVECEISGPADNGEIRAGVYGVPSRAREPKLDGLYPRVNDDALPPTPLGNGWTGLFIVNESPAPGQSDDVHAVTAVLLDCRERRSDLLVTVGTEVHGTDIDDPEQRTALARTATATAKKADRHWSCGADLGRPLRTVPLPINEDEYVPLVGAKGTCAGVPAGGKALSRAWESARGGLIEGCTVGENSTSSRPRYRLRALYGPYSENFRVSSRDGLGPSNDETLPGSGRKQGRHLLSGYWGSAKCPRDHERSYYSIAPVFDPETDNARKDDRDSKKGRAYQRAALKAFAERSARTHGCSDVATP